MELTVSLIINALLSVLCVLLYWPASKSWEWVGIVADRDSEIKGLKNSNEGLAASLKQEEAISLRERTRYLEVSKKCTCGAANSVGIVFNRVHKDKDQDSSK